MGLKVDTNIPVSKNWKEKLRQFFACEKHYDDCGKHHGFTVLNTYS